MTDQEFIDVFNQDYPFERYIVKTPKKITYKYDDLYLTEIFIPKTKIEPILHNGHIMYWTQVDKDEIYVTVKGKMGEARLAFFDFNNGVRDTIKEIILNDFGEWESLYVEVEDDSNLKLELRKQEELIKEKYGE